MSDIEPQPHSELAKFGEELRRERESRGISLKEIADATKISRRFLDAIERNDHKTLPAPVFTRGFVREYARYLGLNAEEIVNRYNYAAAGDDRIEKSAHLDRLVPDRSVERETHPVRYQTRRHARRGETADECGSVPAAGPRRNGPSRPCVRSRLSAEGPGDGRAPMSGVTPIAAPADIPAAAIIARLEAGGYSLEVV